MCSVATQFVIHSCARTVKSDYCCFVHMHNLLYAVCVGFVSIYSSRITSYFQSVEIFCVIYDLRTSFCTNLQGVVVIYLHANLHWQFLFSWNARRRVSGVKKCGRSLSNTIDCCNRNGGYQRCQMYVGLTYTDGYFYDTLSKLQFLPQILIPTIIKFHENLSRESGIIPHGRTDGHEKFNGGLWQLCDCFYKSVS